VAFAVIAASLFASPQTYEGRSLDSWIARFEADGGRWRDPGGSVAAPAWGRPAPQCRGFSSVYGGDLLGRVFVGHEGACAGISEPGGVGLKWTDVRRPARRDLRSAHLREDSENGKSLKTSLQQRDGLPELRIRRFRCRLTTHEPD
jgi:hypothetical protein